MKIVLASNNAGKLAELQELFGTLGVTLITQGTLGIPEAPEPHHTFLENALAKARHASAHSGLPAIADDAGLCVDAFGGLPGVQTAYYATQFGLPKGDDNNVKTLLEQMQGITQRRAALVCTLVATGRATGEITRQPIGSNGFGFDPVLYLPALGKTFAELPPAEKNRLSHRGQAAAAMLQLLRTNWLPAAASTTSS